MPFTRYNKCSHTSPTHLKINALQAQFHALNHCTQHTLGRCNRCEKRVRLLDVFSPFGSKSILMPVKQGVPQGSIVGPMLFVLFSNDLPLHVTNSNVDIYADDFTLTFRSRWSANNSFMEKNLNKEHVVNWSKMNKMVIS